MTRAAPTPGTAIGSWWEYSKARYRHVAEPLEALTDEHGTKVIAKVTGEFPGSPANSPTFSV
ncbi:hypothetical protein [Mesorhizobium sp.]|uniref:hypothetical protein n=1 Tax=Mesorhizobium sp. TaxID=1871066 RepID=UPI00257A3D84|nr:hypothetical protein [Mesorhizobium sp.]